ncbi:MAG: hypothetical protein EHM78_06880 [Myxococcaceae bacterium]|nr:MAG: hypothetical protein EHM78_06880 [Myxococcaceae bacterium]
MSRCTGAFFFMLSATVLAGPPAARIDQMAWLAGQWRGEGTPTDRIDAFVLPPSGGGMVGVFRRVRGGEVTTHAIAYVTEESGSLVLRSKLFDSALRGRESQDAPRPQALESISPTEVRFEKAWVIRRDAGIQLFASVLNVRMSRVASPATSVVAGPPRGEPVVRASPGSTPPPARIGSGAWLEGAWVGTGLGGTSEEAWLAPLAGNMASVHRGMRDGRVTFLEIVTLVEAGQSLAIRLKHFGPDLRGWEPKEKTVDFNLVRTEPGALYLDGMTYRRTPEGLESWVLGPGDGGVRPERFLYQPRSP